MMKKKKTPKKTAKKTTPKAATKKTATKSTVKKKAVKKTVKKVAVKKVAKKTTAKAPAAKKAVKKTATKATGKKAPTKKATTKKEATSPSQARILLNRRNRTQTPAFVRVRTRKNTPIVFSLEDVQDIIQKRKTETKKTKPATQKKATKTSSDTKKKTTSAKKRVLGAASITDILGFNPKKKQSWQSMDESRVPKKLLKSYKDLLKLREQVQQGLDYHAKETLKRSNKEDSGDLSSYSQHMADAGTDTFDRDFALSLVSSEQDLLYEIDEAIQRIFEGSYGICEITGKPIPRQRLAAVPFTRYSLEGQREQERIQNRKAERGGIFGELSGEDAASFSDEDTED